MRSGVKGAVMVAERTGEHADTAGPCADGLPAAVAEAPRGADFSPPQIFSENSKIVPYRDPVTGEVWRAPKTASEGRRERLEALKGDAEAPDEVFELLCAGVTLREVARRWGLPLGEFPRWFAAEHAKVLDAALRVRADTLANEALTKADAAAPETVGVAKLQSDVRLKVAAKWDPDRYGERVRHESAAVPLADAGLVVAAAALLEQVRKGTRTERVIEGEAEQS